MGHCWPIIVERCGRQASPQAYQALLTLGQLSYRFDASFGWECKMKASAIVLPFLFTPLVFADVAAAKMTYAALAVVPKHGKQFHGLGYGATVAAAKRAALAKCSRGVWRVMPYRRCQVVQLYGPGQCVNLVIGASQIWWNSSPKEAREVMPYCQKHDPACRKLVSACLPR